MTLAPPEPAEDPALPPDEPGTDEPEKRPDLPDPAFPEVLPGADPDAEPAPDTQPAHEG